MNAVCHKEADVGSLATSPGKESACCTHPPNVTTAAWCSGPAPSSPSTRERHRAIAEPPTLALSAVVEAPSPSGCSDSTPQPSGPGPGNPRRNPLLLRGAATPPELIGAKGARRRGLGPERPSGRTLASCRRRAAPQPRRLAVRAAHAAAVDARRALIRSVSLSLPVTPRRRENDRRVACRRRFVS